MNSALHSFVVRDATDADSASLLRLVCTSAVERGVRWTIDRESDFFAPFRAEAGGVVGRDRRRGGYGAPLWGASRSRCVRRT